MIPASSQEIPSDLIRLNGLRVTAVVGVLKEERDRAQPLCIDVDLHVDLSDAGLSDSLADTVDYGAVSDVVVGIATSCAPKLLERLAVEISDGVLSADHRIEAVTVSVSKLRPPVPHDLESSGVQMTRRRSR